MRRGIRWVGLLVLLAFVLPAIGADEKKADPKKKPAAEDKKKSDKKDEKKKDDYVSFGTAFVATVISVDDMTIKMMAKIPFRNGRVIAYRDQEVEYDLAEGAKIRIEALPPKVDDDGKKVKRTPEEIKELKGKEGSWGYTGTMDNVVAGRIVRVFLGKKRGADKEDPPLITQIQVAKMPGDDKVENALLPGEKKPAGEGSEDMVPFGRPFIAMFERLEGESTIHLITRNSVFNNGKVEYQDKKGSFELADGVKVRVELPPPELDENGKLKKYTKEEIAEMKGEDKEWGFPGTLENLQPGRFVRVSLAKPKGAERTDPPVVVGLNIAKEPGDTKIDPMELVFIEKKKKGEEKEDKDKKEDKKEEKKDEDKPPPYGRPFLATVTRVDNGLRVALNIKERFLNGTKVEFRDKQVEYTCYEAVHVRTQEPPLVFDDKGAIKKYTKEELVEMKGKEGYWGFPADMESVQAGRFVKVFLGKFPEDKKEPPVILQIYVAKPPKVVEKE